MFEVLDLMCEPVRSTKYSAYVDLFAREDITIRAGEPEIVKLGVKIDKLGIKKIISEHYHYKKENINKNFNELEDAFLKSHYLEVALRSSLGVKGLVIANGIGIIDLDYPDEIGLIVHNPTNINKGFYTTGEYSRELHMRTDFKEKTSFKISKGDKVAQCTLKEHKGYLMGYESDAIRDGGFGSTGK